MRYELANQWRTQQISAQKEKKQAKQRLVEQANERKHQFTQDKRELRWALKGKNVNGYGLQLTARHMPTFEGRIAQQLALYTVLEENPALLALVQSRGIDLEHIQNCKTAIQSLQFARSQSLSQKGEEEDTRGARDKAFKELRHSNTSFRMVVRREFAAKPGYLTKLGVNLSSPTRKKKKSEKPALPPIEKPELPPSEPPSEPPLEGRPPLDATG